MPGFKPNDIFPLSLVQRFAAPELALTRLASVRISLSQIGVKQPIYTVPVNAMCLPLLLIPRSTVTNKLLRARLSLSGGFNAGADDCFTGNGEMNAGGMVPSGDTGDTFAVIVNGYDGVLPFTIVDFYGYLIPADANYEQ